ncbi:hypothetical protein G7Y79_00003g009370 [Physcia stellaris]|nr:hypothetical protein G7Y79_00003g009370 [Physcia stellaris]
MNTRTKVLICILMGLGVFTAACAIAKAVFLRGVFAKDYTYAITEPAVWTVTEHLVGITIASIPSLKPLFNRIFDIASQRSNSSGRTFQKINARERGVQVQISSLVNGGNNSRKTLRMNDKDITKTTELRMSTETDIEFTQLPKPPTAWNVPERNRPLPDYTPPGAIV